MTSVLMSNRQSASLLIGGPGCGKSTVAREVGCCLDVEHRFGPRRFRVSVEGMKEIGDLANAIGSAIGISITGNLMSLALWLEAAPTLIIIDDVESLHARSPVEVEQALAYLLTVPSLHLIACRRGREIPLGVAWDIIEEVDPLSPSDSKRLFLDVARPKKPNEQVTDQFCAALAGIPLALELAGHAAVVFDSIESAWRSGAELVPQWQSAMEWMPQNSRHWIILSNCRWCRQFSRLARKKFFQ